MVRHQNGAFVSDERYDEVRDMVICYVDMEHESALRDPSKRSEHRAHCADVRQRLEGISGAECIVQRYSAVTREGLDEMGARALVLSGNVTDWEEYDEVDLREMYHIVREAPLPVLGICGGLQFIAMAHGAALGPMRRLATGEEDSNADYAPGYFKEWGFVPVTTLHPDPLFDGLESPTFLEAHYWEVKEVPTAFELLASTDVCRVQAIRRIGEPVYAIQFHPEAYILAPPARHRTQTTADGRGQSPRNGDAQGVEERRSWLVNLVYPEGYAERQPDGHRLLVNFFRIAGIEASR